MSLGGVCRWPSIIMRCRQSNEGASHRHYERNSREEMVRNPFGGSQHPSFEDSPQSVGDFVETDKV